MIYYKKDYGLINTGKDLLIKLLSREVLPIK